MSAQPLIQLSQVRKTYNPGLPNEAEVLHGIDPVSYTHLDVYKRQH